MVKATEAMGEAGGQAAGEPASGLRPRPPLAQQVAATAGVRDRLLRRSQAWDGFMRQMLARMDLGPGHGVLEVGSGAGAMQRMAAERVGAAGRVMALDIDGATGRQVLAELLTQGPPIFDFVEDDIETLDAAPGAPYDLVIACRVVFHLADPGAALRRMWDQLRPGGVLLVLDTDLTTTRSFPPQPALERGIRLANDAFRRAGCDLECGTRMAELFALAGLGMPDGAEACGLITSAAAGAALLRSVIGSLQPLVRAAGLLDEAALQRLDQQLAAVRADAGTLRWPDLVATWKRKGAAS